MAPRPAHLLLIGLFALAGCDLYPEPTGPRLSEEDVEFTVLVTSGEGIDQEVSLSPGRPATGDTIQIRSVLRGTSQLPVRVSARLCGADLEGTLESNPVGPTCGGYSVTRPLASSDSLQTQELRTVASPPGTYEIRLRHALDPELWVTIPVEVRQR